MKSRGRTPGRSVWHARGLFLVPLALGMGVIGAAGAEAPPIDRGEMPAGPRPPAPVQGLDASAAVLRYRGTPVPGSRISIELEGSSDPDASYQWSQIEGPAVVFEAQPGPKVQFTVPADAKSLGFLLAIRDSNGERTARVVVPIRQPEGRAEGKSATLRAEGGDDQIGLVGRRITLNGTRGSPRAGAAYRWFAIAGPRVEQSSQDGGYYSFTPTGPGIYRFGLVVASAGAGELSISDVDEVVVTVGEYSPTLGARGGAGIPAAAIDQMLQGPGGVAGRATLEQAAGVFDAISARASLYSNFAELSSELARRLDAIVPADPSWRQFWSQAVFAPLTQHVVTEMLAAGLDLRGPQGQQQGLGSSQQERLQQLFSSYGREFRSRAQAR